MANSRSDADSTILALWQANSLAVGDPGTIPVPPSACLAHKQGLRAPVGQRKAGFTSSLYVTDYHIGHKGLRIE